MYKLILLEYFFLEDFVKLYFDYGGDKYVVDDESGWIIFYFVVI